MDNGCDLEIRDLQLLAAVAETGSLAKASLVLHVTPSALSHRLRRLEHMLGTRLFARGRGAMRLTAGGERLVGPARSVLAQLTEAELAVRAAAGTQRSVLRLAVECHTCYDLLPGTLEKFRARHPTIRVQMEPAIGQSPLQRLTDGVLDVAVVPASEEVAATLDSTALLADELVALTPKNHSLADLDFIDARALTGETVFPWITPERSTVLEDFLRHRGGAMNAVHVVPSSEAAIGLVEARLGVAILPWRRARPYGGCRAVRAVPLAPDGLWQRWDVVISRRSAPAIQVREFIRLLVVEASARQSHIQAAALAR